jgi:hypothetical protein
MLDRQVVEDFIDTEFEEGDWEIPDNINKDALVEAFCQYTEDDYYEWLEDNFKSFFSHGDPDWNWIKERIKTYEKH